MSYNYCLLDDQTRLIIGYCNEIDNFDSSVIFEDIDEHGEKDCINKLNLKKFIFCEDFKDYIKKKKASLNRLFYINIKNKYDKKIADVGFIVEDEKRYYKLGFPPNGQDFELKGYLTELFLKADLDILNKWRIQPPNTINQWANLETDERRAWLRSVLKYYSIKNENLKEYKGPKEVTYYLDGRFITDYPSFFCALGEAINGPCGYFGFYFGNLRNCIFGGYGAPRTFTIIWNHSDVAIKNLTQEAWQDEINFKKNEENLTLFEGPSVFEDGDKPLMQHILKFFEDEGIRVILK